jgi:hypothetical protein
VVIGLSRPKDYDPQQGAVFVSEFTKARNLVGEGAESPNSRSAEMRTGRSGLVGPSRLPTYDRVVAMTRDGLSRPKSAPSLRSTSHPSPAPQKGSGAPDLPARSHEPPRNLAAAVASSPSCTLHP